MALLALLTFTLLANLAIAADTDGAVDYVGAGACESCHEREYAAWEGSHHDLAMQVAAVETVLGDFDDAVFDYFGDNNRFFVKDGRYYVNTRGADGEFEDFEVSYTFGVYPLQQYLVSFDDRRIQPLPFAWDSRAESEGGQRWFHLYPDEHIAPGDRLFWTGMDQNWNFVCAECHSTNLKRGYEPATDRYDTTWSEIDVSCEACHGPASKHLEVVERAETDVPFYGFSRSASQSGAWIMNSTTGIAENENAANRDQIESCARCHSRRIPLTEDYRHDKSWMQAYRPQVLLDGLYFADGQIHDEVYVYGSFLQSKMYQRGVACSDCHDAHSLEVKAKGNGLCASCHLPTKYDDPSHHFHEPDSEGAQCVTCHMPSRTYMVNDPRRDHGFRIPRPELSSLIGSPDVCTGCHQDRSAQWAQDMLDARKDGKAPVDRHFGYAIHAARTGALDAEQRLLDVAENPDETNIVKATAALLLGNYISPGSVQTLAALLKHDDPLVRLNAVAAFESSDPRLKIQVLPAMLDDPILAVRIEAAQSLASVPIEIMSIEINNKLLPVIDEYVAVQKKNAERPESHVNLGNIALKLEDVESAESHYEAALRIDPSHTPARVNLADLYRRQQREREAERVLMEGIDRTPDSAALRHAHGLLLIRAGARDRAIAELQEAVDLAPDNTRFRYVYAISLNSSGQTRQAIEELELASRSNPGDISVLQALIDLHLNEGNTDRAREYAANLVERTPWDRRARELLQQLSP